MQISTEIQHSVSPEQLAKALAGASPAKFAEFWFAFNKVMENDATGLDMFAKAMASANGSNRKKVLKELVRLIEYYEVKAERSE